MDNSTKNYETCFIARQPVFTPSGTLWGYELLFRNSDRNVATFNSPTAATAEVMVDGMSLVFSGSERRLKALINVPANMLDIEVLETLPRNSCVLELLEDVIPTPAVLEKLTYLKKRGFTLALNDYVGQKELAPLLPLVNIVKVDFLNMTSSERSRITDELADLPATLLAEKLETAQDMREATGLGYSLLQGFFFQKPEILTGRKVTATQTARIHALCLLSSPDIQKKQLLEFFTHSPQLAFRLLRFVNSVTFSTTKPITSLEQALIYLGTRNLRHWLMTALLADGHLNDCKQEVAVFGTIRACFLQRLAQHLNTVCQDKVFMLGLFSLLDGLYDQPFVELFRDVPLQEDVHLALCQGQGPLMPWLQTAKRLERGDFAKAEELLTSLGVTSMDAVRRLHQDAQLWVQRTTH